MKFEANTPLKKHYFSLLEALGLCVNDEGVIESSGNATYKPMTQDGLVWLWPDHTVSKPADGRFIVFNPANEVGAQAPFMDEIIKRMETRLNVRFMSLMTECFAAASDSDRKTGSSGYIALCRALPEITPSMNTLMSKLLQKWTSTFRDDKRYHVLAMASRGSATIGSDTFPRTALLRSPVYNFFMESDGRSSSEHFSFGGVYKFLGVSCKKGEMETMRNFWEYVFPTINSATQKVNKNTTTTQWLLGTRNNFGNAFFSIVNLYAKASMRIREIADSLGNEYKDHPLDFSVDWVKDIQPAMEAKQEVMSMPTPANLGVVAATAPNPLAKPTPVATSGVNSLNQPKPTGKVSLLDLVRSGAPSSVVPEAANAAAGRIVQAGGATYLVVGDRALPVGAGGGQVAAPAAQVVIKRIGNPEMRQDGHYYAPFSDSLLYRVEFVGGEWVRAAQQQMGGAFGGNNAGVFERGRGGFAGNSTNSGGVFTRGGNSFSQQPQVDPLSSMFRR